MVRKQKVKPKNPDSWGKFRAIPDFFPVPTGGGHWVQTGYMLYYSAIIDDQIKTPPGSVNNLASIPIPFRNLFNPNGPHRLAAVLHDDPLYAYQGLISVASAVGEMRLDRKTCDAIMFEAMLTTKHDYYLALSHSQKWLLDKAGFKDKFLNIHDPLVKPWMANCIWIGPRIGGWWFWDR